nr:myb/SANT-like DNA-binding domain-containing protein 7 isoform X1 [Anolis sagrei ordinatus]XP_060616193.1 myb/SANT-like DNA-binding domain-containing protein 7 isoform X1 [Anolis sagrei ordinatus]XP_060616194.1 myb/SANT-like DNA-binding domain-containing protein 7 isoform X1 [Anolis sagrei ordinatus]
MWAPDLLEYQYQYPDKKILPNTHTANVYTELPAIRSHSHPVPQAMMSPANANRAKRARGMSWSPAETEELIAIWGEPIVQEQLHESHRNLDVFEKVAEKMRAMGRDRTAEECRTKTKSLRSKYREACEHIARNGRASISMPYFDELDNILRGDGTLQVKRMPQTTGIQKVTVGQASTSQQQADGTMAEGSQEFYQNSQGDMLDAVDSKDNIVLLNPMEDIADTASACGEASSVYSKASTHPPPSPVARSASPASEESHGEQAAEGPESNLLWTSAAREQGAPVANRMAMLPPSVRLGEHRRRRDRRTVIAATSSATDRILQHSVAQMKALMEHLERERIQQQEYLDRESVRQQELRDRESARQQEFQEWDVEFRQRQWERECRDRDRLNENIEAQTVLLARLVDILEQNKGCVCGGGREVAHGQASTYIPVPQGLVPAMEVDPQEIHYQVAATPPPTRSQVEPSENSSPAEPPSLKRPGRPLRSQTRHSKFSS